MNQKPIIFLTAFLFLGSLAIWVKPTRLACPFCGMGNTETIGSRVLLNDLTVSAKVQKIATVIKDGVFQKEATYHIEKTIASLNGQGPPGEISAAAGAEEKEGEQVILFLSHVVEKGWVVMGRQSDPAGETAAYLAAFLALGDRPSVRQRIEFFAPRLESANRAIQDDAVNAFSFVRTEELLANRDVLPADKLRVWLADDKIPLFRRSLYGFLLGVAGDQRDAKILRGFLEAQRKNCTPDAAAFFTGYCLADRKEGLAFLQAVLADRSADPMFRTQAAYAARILDGILPKTQLREALRPLLVRLLDDPAFAPDVLRLIRDWQDRAVLPELTAWYVKAHDKLSQEVRMEVIQLAARLPEKEGAALREQVNKLDGELLKMSGEFPPPATRPAPGK